MAIEKQINLNVNSNIEGSISELRSLKRELKNTAAGSEDFKKLYNQIDDLEDKIKSAKNVSSDWVDSLENVGGPLGSLGAGINKVKVSTQSFGAALKATGIGLIVSAVAGLAAAFSQNESAMKKLKPLTEAFEKILGGIFRALEPLIDSFMDLAMKALPYITQGIGLFYSGLVGLFTYVKEAGGGYIKMMKGIVTLDFDAAKEGFNQMKDSFNKAVKSGEEAYKRFESGSKEQTKAEKEELAKRREEQQKHQEELAKKQQEAAQKAAEERKRKAEEARKAEEDRKKAELDLEQKYLDELLNMNAKTEQEKLDLQAQRDLEEINRIAKTENEKANLMALYNEKYATLNQELKDKADAEAAEKQKTKDEADKAAKDKKAQEDIDREKGVAEAKKNIQQSQLQAAEGFIGLIKSMGENNKGLQKAALIAESAIGISKIIINTQSANAATRLKYALLPGGAALAATEIVMNKINAGIGIAANLAGTAKGLAALGGGGGGAGGADVGGGGGGAAPAAPSFNVVGAGGTNQIAQVMSEQGAAPVQAFVVASNVTSAQSLNRNIVNNATLG
jgi:membrane protein involved in colicin uptake